jgi:hypothetical protein
MNYTFSLSESIKKAVNIKNSGGIPPLYVKLSNSLQDPLNKTREKSNQLINKLNNIKI